MCLTTYYLTVALIIHFSNTRNLLNIFLDSGNKNLWIFESFPLQKGGKQLHRRIKKAIYSLAKVTERDKRWRRFCLRYWTDTSCFSLRNRKFALQSLTLRKDQRYVILPHDTTDSSMKKPSRASHWWLWLLKRCFLQLFFTILSRCWVLEWYTRSI